MSVLALIDPASSYGRHCTFPRIAWDGLADPAQLAGAEVVLMCPESATEPGVDLVVGWKRAGRIGARLVFGTYKGVHYMPDCGDVVAAYVVHSRSYRAGGAGQPWFVPLALQPHHAGPDEQYVFVGGRKRRDFAMAQEALQGRRAVFVGDKAGDVVVANTVHAVVPKQIPLDDYKDLISRSSLVVVPVMPGDYAHGHSDVVRGLLSGRPVVVTRGASCDDYIAHKRTGYLADFTADDFCAGVSFVLNNLREMKWHVLRDRGRYSLQNYEDSLRAWIETTKEGIHV